MLTHALVSLLTPIAAAQCVGGPTYTRPALPLGAGSALDTAIDVDPVGYAPGDVREIEFALRRPSDPGPRPLVIISHGGAYPGGRPQHEMVEWSEFLAARGFVVATVSHPGRTERQRHDLCVDLGIPSFFHPISQTVSLTCADFKHLNYDRPRDLSTVLDHIAGLADPLIDLENVMALGWSGGAGGIQMLAGAERGLPALGGGTSLTNTDMAADPRFTAFVALSPQGVGNDHWRADSYGTMDGAPMLFLTGAFDGHDPTASPPDLATERYEPFDLGPSGAGHKILWIKDTHEVDHGFYGTLDPATCHDPAPGACDELEGALQDTVLAWADARLLGDTCAQDWLDDGEVLGLSIADLRWEQK